MAETIHEPAHILRVERENAKTVSLVLDRAMSAEPGQFLMAWLPGLDEKPFSIAGANPLTVAVSRVGPFSEALHALSAGDTLWVRGPFGRGWTVGPGSVLLVGGGYGAAPLAFLAAALRGAGAEVEAAVGARAAADLLYERRFAALGVPFHAATEDGSAGARGKVTDLAAALLARGGFTRVCACGPEGMLEALKPACRAAGVPAHFSYEAWMRCGIGLCGACEHGGRLLCMDGPVLEAE